MGVMAIDYRVYDYDTSTGLTILPLSPNVVLNVLVKNKNRK